MTDYQEELENMDLEELKDQLGWAIATHKEDPHPANLWALNHIRYLIEEKS